MSRSRLFAIFALLLPPVPCFAQLGGMGGMGGGMGGMGGGMAQGGMGMGGRGMGMGMGRMGMRGSQMRTALRTVQIELIGGQKIQGKLELDPVIVASEMGEYQIKPDRVKLVRLEPRPGKETEPFINGSKAIVGAVLTTTGQEIKGKVQCPSWNLDVEFGTLNVDPAKVRVMTFSAPAEAKETKPGPLSQVKPAALDVTLIEGPNAVALMVTGEKITRLAAAGSAAGDWIPIDLREPVEGQAVPIVGPGIVVYGLGRHVYAFGSEARRWDVLDLPAGVVATPIVGNQTARVESNGQIHEFSARTGKWKHIDIHSLLDTVQDKARKAIEQPALRP